MVVDTQFASICLNSYRKSVKTENRGLAVHAATSKPTSLLASPSGLSSSERREVPRHPFIASAQGIDLTSGARMSAPVSELSLKGCLCLAKRSYTCEMKDLAQGLIRSFPLKFLP